ncbi:MAG: DUF2384 domain-containing protein [Nitrosospira sp.]|nr:DUF2384 domain-containing protein [Nitrosospira sp.]
MIREKLTVKPSKAEAATGTFVEQPAARTEASETETASVVKVITREQRLRQERAMFSALLDQSTPPTEMNVVKLVRERLPVRVVDLFFAEGITQQEVNKLVTPRRTLTHRRAKAERLTIDESDRVVRLARVIAQSESVFDDKDKAMRWLRRPMKRFEGRTPIEMLDTDVGSRLVEEALVQIDEGYFV